MSSDSKFNRSEYKIRFNDRSFSMSPDQITYYDPDGSSEFSAYIEANLDYVKHWFSNTGYKFCYIPDLCKNYTEEEIRYIKPNWDGQPLKVLGNDSLKPLLTGKYSKTPAGFIRLSDETWMTYKHYPLAPLDYIAFEEQLEIYKHFLYERFNTCNSVSFSITGTKKDENLYPVLTMKSDDYTEDEIIAEISRMAKQLRKDGIEGYVLHLMVPTKDMLSRMVINDKYDVILPDFDNMVIKMSPLPKTVYFLFLKHEEGIAYKDMIDHREELGSIYKKITNRTSTDVIDSSLDKLTDPLNNSLNEKCSRIREAFEGHMDTKLADNYCVTGERADIRQIALPRSLVEWQCVL